MKKIFTFLYLLGSLFVFSNTDKYRLILTSDPSTTITIAWNQVSSNNPVVRYGTTDFGTTWASYPNSKTADRVVAYRGMNNHFARITGLTPNTAYYFVIKDDAGTSIRMWFKTCPNDLSRLSFIAGGDSRNNRSPRQNANTLVSKLKPHAVFFGGDMIDVDNNTQWIEWFDDWQLTRATDGRMFPIVPARGNHEAANTINSLFDIPLVEYYALTFGNNLYRAYTLNSEIAVSATSAQSVWLYNDFAANTGAIWKGAQFHTPFRPHQSAKADNLDLQTAWAQSFYDNNVKLVIDCDSHCVKSTWPLRPSTAPGNVDGFVRDDVNGTVFVGEGCWGAPLRPADDNRTWTRNSGSFNEFKLIFVDQNKIEIRTINVGSVAADIATVGVVSNTDPFTLPANLNVWNPSNGSVIVINKAVVTPAPQIELSTISTFTCYESGNNITNGITFANNGSTITSVGFYLDNVLIGTDTTAPFELTQNYTFGSHQLVMVATGIDGQTDSVVKNFFVGFSTQTLSFPIVVGDDDVEEHGSTGEFYTNSSDIEMVYDVTPSVNYQKVGLRFSSIRIPQGAVINSAYIQFTADEVNTAAASLNFQIENSQDAEPYVESVLYGLSGRDYFPDKINWVPPAWNTIDEAGVNQRSPELRTLLQKVVDNNDWEENNAVGIMITGTGASLTNTAAKRVADAYEGGATKASKLVVNFTYACCGALTTNWNGSAWSNGVPNKIYEANFTGNYNATSDIEACSVNVLNNAIVTVNSGNTLTVKNDISVAPGSNLTINNNAALVQINSISSNFGDIIVKRNSAPMVRLDYTAWSSPVTGQQLKAFSPSTLDNRFYQYLFTGTNTATAFQAINPLTNFVPSKGYLIRAANDWPTTLTSFLSSFTGNPNNGGYTQNIGIGYNLVGNPYASPISVDTFFEENPTISTVYFWNHNVAAVGGLYPQNNYSYRNRLGGVAAASGGAVPNAYIQTAQGFYVNSSVATTANFSNKQRVKAVNSTQFFKQNNVVNSSNEIEKHIFRLNLNDSQNAYNQILVGYSNESTNGIDTGIDAKALDNSQTYLYSVLDTSDLIIQGRSIPFVAEDIVPLGLKINTAGNYSISFDSFEGIFANQEIYLKDKLNNVVHDIKLSPYNFNSNEGTFNDRFEIVYENSTLSNDTFNFENVQVYSNNKVITALSPNELLNDIFIYNVQGQLIYSKKDINENQFIVSNLNVQNQILLITIKTNLNKEKTFKVIY
ncbi:T9SS sorting signal type C domain-containing protein [Flavobacterium sp. F372]|uniref:Fibronectin type III domain-containing protein n=1 Tax=Flavobacterium bernardetii TaxID=2813823 RepID=A0ABR7IXG3_9FLAO|nr:fibronectin type III domain-containing protein [Flavobacterium bernardetii]MBC5834442.1 fibronectin type III domain-containing protein [Flavobacterium bernardetii]NHF69919.1 T9SS sorting signal type C domain-containing protein [Flavobacterium bernardetii]